MIEASLIRSPLGDQVYGLLRAKILSGDFTSGQRLSPQGLSELLHVSVTPIRDALRRLEGDGLIEVVPRRGTFVFQFTAQAVKDVFESRRIVEQAAMEALPDAPASVFERVSTIVGEMADLLDGETVSDYPRYLELDQKLHACIVELLHNERLTQFHQSLRAHTYVARALVPAANRRLPQTHEEHQELLRALQQRDVARAKQAIAVHLGNAADDILRRMPPVPEGPAPETAGGSAY